jgi:hypothetical protein
VALALFALSVEVCLVMGWKENDLNNAKSWKSHGHFAMRWWARLFDVSKNLAHFLDETHFRTYLSVISGVCSIHFASIEYNCSWGMPHQC